MSPCAKCRKRDARAQYANTWAYESGRERNTTQKLKNRQRQRSSRNR